MLVHEVLDRLGNGFDLVLLVRELERRLVVVLEEEADAFNLGSGILGEVLVMLDLHRLDDVHVDMPDRVVGLQREPGHASLIVSNFGLGPGWMSSASCFSLSAQKRSIWASWSRPFVKESAACLRSITEALLRPAYWPTL